MPAVNPGAAQSRPQVPWTVAQIERLQRDRSYRDEQGLHFIEGARGVLHAAEAGIELRQLVVSAPLLKVRAARQLIRSRRAAGTPCLELTPEQFRSIGRLQRASGIGAVARQHWSRLHRRAPTAGLCWVVLERVRAPGNLGTLIRTAEAVGAAGFIFVSDTVDPFDPAVVRASMGALFGQALVRTSVTALRHWIRRHRCRVVGASPDGQRSLHRQRFRRPTLLLLGEERKGLNGVLRGLCHDLVRIPMVGRADSLNLAVAGSLLLYEVYRGGGIT